MCFWTWPEPTIAGRLLNLAKAGIVHQGSVLTDQGMEARPNFIWISFWVSCTSPVKKIQITRKMSNRWCYVALIISLITDCFLVGGFLREETFGTVVKGSDYSIHLKTSLNWKRLQTPQLIIQMSHCLWNCALIDPTLPSIWTFKEAKMKYSQKLWNFQPVCSVSCHQSIWMFNSWPGHAKLVHCQSKR
jgi:hypothetical protein